MQGYHYFQSRRNKILWCIKSNKSGIFSCLIAFFLLVGSGFFQAATVCAQPAVKEVLVIPSYNFDYLGSKWFLRGLMQGFAENPQVKITYLHENLELATHAGDEEYFQTMAASLKIKYEKTKPDLIVVQYKQALEFMIRYGEGIFADTPVLFAGLEVEDYHSKIQLPANYTGVIAAFSAKKNIDLILKNHPNTKKIYIVAGITPVEQDMVNSILQQGEFMPNRVEMIPLNRYPFSQILQIISNREDGAVVMYQALLIDATGKTYIPAVAAKVIAQTAAIPVYGMLDTYMGSEIVGGFLVHHENMGKRTAQMGGAILQGTSIATLPVVTEAIGQYTFDWRQLRRWEIDESELPIDSTVEFKEFSLWELYKWHLIIAIIVLLIQGFLIVGLLVNRSIRQRAEDLLRDSEERYRSVMQQSSDAIAIVDLDSRRIMEANDRWLTMFGYSRSEIGELTIYDFMTSCKDEMDKYYDMALQQGYLAAELRRFRTKNGRRIEVERAAVLVHFKGKEVLVITVRDITAERRLQQQISNDVLLAAAIQKSLLPVGLDDALVNVAPIYEPYRVVSGDFYDYAWSSDHNRLTGFVLDASGHGIASSLQGFVVSTLFRETLDSPMRLADRVRWINEQVFKYFTDETFAAAICFEFDFTHHTLTFVTAGIYEFLVSSQSLPVLLKAPGSLIGVTETPEYFERKVDIRPGDAFYFMTDGIFEYLDQVDDIQPDDFANTVAFLRQAATRPERRDDCCALCIQVAGRPTFPLLFRFLRPGERGRIRTRIRNILREFAPDAADKIDVALGEAINNAVREGMDIRVKLNFIGRYCTVRVKDSGKGFDGRGAIALLQAIDNEEFFQNNLFNEGGRGISIMLAWMDKVVYNRDGNEVLLVKRIR